MTRYDNNQREPAGPNRPDRPNRPGRTARGRAAHKGPAYGTGSLRVIGGVARGRRLRVPPESVTRPTRDMVRENVFNLLGSRCDLAEARVLDLFAGSGAYGIEALSRGARSCTFVEQSSEAAEVIRVNLEAVGLLESSRVVTGTVSRALRAHLSSRSTPVELVFADPPYRYSEWPELLALVADVLAPSGIVITESSNVVDVGADWYLAVSRRYGTTQINMWTKALGGADSATALGGGSQ